MKFLSKTVSEKPLKLLVDRHYTILPTFPLSILISRNTTSGEVFDRFLKTKITKEVLLFDGDVLEESGLVTISLQNDEISYSRIGTEIGPIDLSVLHHVLEHVTKYTQEGKKVAILFGNSSASKYMANALLILGCFVLITLKGEYLHSKEWRGYLDFYRTVQEKFKVYRDCGSDGRGSEFRLAVYDVLCGFFRASSLGFYNFDKFYKEAFKEKHFNGKMFEMYEKFADVNSGDANWIVPGTILAFAGPSDDGLDEHDDICCSTVLVLEMLKKLNVGLVIRLNSKIYTEETFVSEGIKVVDLNYQDGSIPRDQIWLNFISELDNFFKLGNGKAVGVHCKAGLGRTATLIGMFLMKNYNFEGREVIGWARLVRPGSVIGIQQEFLASHAKFLLKNISHSEEGQGHDLMGNKNHSKFTKPLKLSVAEEKGEIVQINN